MKKEEAIQRLERQIARADELRTIKRFSPEFDKWKRDTEVLIRHIFKPYAQHLNDFRDVNYNMQIWTSGTPDSVPQKVYEKGLNRAKAVLMSFVDEVKEYFPDKKTISDDIKEKNNHKAYTNETRISELKAVPQKEFDLTRLIRLLEEIEICFRNECYMAVPLLVRSIIDHVPPIFNAKNFKEVASNYLGSKSFKDSMDHLENSCRKIADQQIHCQIRKREVLPNRTQVDFKNDLDVLLAEIIRIMK